VIDFTSAGFSWRGYPITIVSDGAADVLIPLREHGIPRRFLPNLVDLYRPRLSALLESMTDLAGPGEPADWTFSGQLDGVTVWAERFGGVRDDRGHHGGGWSLYLPGER
jgi:hypothetical protein